MNLLLLNQFYPPDPAPTGRYLHALARELVSRGHSVRVLCSRRAYDGKDCFASHENIDGVDVSRLVATGFGRRSFVGKTVDYATFYLSLAAALLAKANKADLILSLTTPPYIGLLGKAAAGMRGCRHAHWIMDLYPDVLFAHNRVRAKGVACSFLRALTRYELRGADAVFSLGEQMARHIADYAGRAGTDSPIVTVPLWSEPGLGPWDASVNPLRAQRRWGEDETVFLYSGNMGLGHSFSEFLEAARRLGGEGPRWVFSGGGKRKREVETFAKSHPAARIEVLDYVPQNQLRAHLCAADVHLASLDSAWQGLMVPSKLQGSFAVGRPVLFVGGRQCETAAWIQESGGGWVVEQGDREGLISAIRQGSETRERARRGKAAIDFWRKNFQMSQNCAQIAQKLEALTFSLGGAALNIRA